MTKKPTSRKSLTEGAVLDGASPKQVSKRQQRVLEAVNTLIQNSIMIVLDSVTSKCNCQTCQTARSIAPQVRVLIEQGRVKEIKKVE